MEMGWFNHQQATTRLCDFDSEAAGGFGKAGLIFVATMGPPKLTFLEGFYGKSPGVLGDQIFLFFMGFGGSWQLQHMFCVSMKDQWVLFHPFEFCCG